MLAVLAGILVACGCVLADIPLNLQIEESFDRFVRENNRDYFTDQERLARFKIFKENVEEAIRMNAEINDSVDGISQFMDMTRDEIKSMYGCLDEDRSQTDCNILTDKDLPAVVAPEAIDWREHKVVTKVKNQGFCGSCWAFSTIGNVEAMYAMKYKKLMEFSEQQLVDCNIYSNGCSGGSMALALYYFISAGGVMSEADYPYVATEQKCKFDENKVKVKISACNLYNITSQEKLKEIVYKNGPVTIENGKKYWLIKNSWSPTYGDNGYVKIERGEGSNACGIMNPMYTTTAILA